MVVLTLLSMGAHGQQDPFAWVPLQVGSRWMYGHEWKSGDRRRPDIDRWTTEERITGWVTIPEGLVVLREVKLQPGSYVRQRGNRHNGDLVTRDREPYLVRGNCLYVVDGWNGDKQELRPEYRKYLSEGVVSPEFCFPLQTGAEWGNNDIPWKVEPAREEVNSLLPPEYAGAVHIFSSHFGSGGWEDVWFQKGVGVVAEHYIHNGTYDEYSKTLLSFQ